VIKAVHGRIPRKKLRQNTHAAHEAALALDWPSAAKDLSAASQLLAPVVPEKPSAYKSNRIEAEAFDVWKLQARLDRALALAAGLKVSADANRSDLVVGETQRIVTKQKCRPEIPCGFAPINCRGRPRPRPASSKKPNVPAKRRAK